MTTAVVVESERNAYNNVAELIADRVIIMYQYVQYANLFDEIDETWFEVEQIN